MTLSGSGPAPLSFAQERLWFLARFEPANAASTLPVVLRLRGGLDGAALAAAFRDVLRRHEVLRAAFGDREGSPVWWPGPVPAHPLPRVDLVELPPSRREAEARRLARAEGRRPFAFPAEPPCRGVLLRLAADEHWLAIVLHRIAADPESAAAVVRETGLLYGAFRDRAPSPLPEPPPQMAGIARRQREELRGDALAQRLRFWRERLEGAPGLLDLPADRPRPPLQSYRGGAVMAWLRGNGTPLASHLLAALQILLHRYTGREEPLVGVHVPSRWAGDVVGPLSDTRISRAGLAGDPLVSEVLGQLRGESAGQDRELPLAKLVEELRPERSLAYHPLVQVGFGEMPVLVAPFNGLEAVALPVIPPTAWMDLALLIRKAGQDVELVLEHSDDLFDRSTAERMLGHLLNLLAGIASGPDRRISDLPLLGQAERHQILYEGRRLPRTGLGAPPSVLDAFAAQVARRPDGVAVESESGEERLTYAELAARAGRLAGRLRELGCGPEALVGVCLERSPDLLVALLGVLRAGAAYVPLDPAFPPVRLAQMIEDSHMRLLLTERSLDGCLPPCPRLLLDAEDAPEDWAVPGAGSVPPERLAYVIYTSGSTGRPKGVQISHGALANFLASMTEEPGISERDTLLAVTTLSFDIAGLELLLPLIAGARVVIARRETAGDGMRLSAALAACDATVMQATPATWRLLLEAGWDGARPRRLLCGGEALPRDLATRLLAFSGELWNLYGPTETTIWSLAGRVAPGGGPVPLGRPLAATRILVLDRQSRLVPAGVPGELCIGGAGLARGYFRRPDLTAERFVPHPHPEEPGDRLYRTGDLACVRPGGEIEFLGRIDHQVKVRGFRIELGEVEAALASHPDLARSAVVVRESARGARLVACLVPMPGRGPAAAEIRAHLLRTLPDYMVPTAFVRLEVLPLTPNGKVDRKALSAPEPVGAVSEAFVAPRTPLEELVAQIWADVLGRDRIGLHESFFETGGDSLLGMRLFTRFRDALGVDLPQRLLFLQPTVAGLTAEIEAARRGGGHGPSPLQPAGRDALASLNQERLWFFDRLTGGSNAYNLLYAASLEGELRVGPLQWALSEIVHRHRVLRSRFRGAGTEPRVETAPAGPVPLPLLDLSALSGAAREAEAGRLSRLLQALPFDLAEGPLLRTTLLRLEERRHLLLWAVHHIAFDGGSLEVLVRGLATLYGAAAPLPEPPVRYADFAAWQRDWVRGEEARTQVTAWRDRLGDHPPATEIAADLPRGTRRALLGQRWVDLDAATIAGLRGLGRQLRVTPFMVALAALDVLLHQSTGEDRITVGSLMANRRKPGSEQLIGFFANTVPLAVDLTGDPGLPELLYRVREAVLHAGENQELPFEKLVEDLEPARTAGGQPLFQIMFLLQSVPPRVELPGLALVFQRPEGTEREAALDLSAGLLDTGDGLALFLEWNRSLFEEATAARLLGGVEAVLCAAVENPERRLSALPRMAAAERRQVLRETRATDSRERAAVIEGEVSGLRSRLSPKKQELLSRRLRRAVRPAMEGRPRTIPRRGGGEPALMSFSQERLWLLDRLTPGGTAYNLLDILLLHGSLAPGALEGALLEVLRRHESLRTVFVESGDTAVQVIRPLPARALPAVDLAGLPAGRRRPELERIALGEARRPFDLGRGPLVRARLLCLGEHEHALVLVKHHIISDAWSFAVFLRELTTLYEACRQGCPSPLPEPEIQYADFAVWQRERLSGEILEDHLAWWRERLAGIAPLLELPSDRPRPPVQGQRGGRVLHRFDRSLGERVGELARSRGATFFMALLAGFQALLARLSGQGDIVVGSPIANRTQVETEALIGFFANTLVLRGDLGAAPCFVDLLAQAREATLGAYTHQDLPFEKLVHELRPERSLAHAPLVQVVLVLQNTPTGAMGVAGLMVEPLSLPEDTVKYDLLVSLAELRGEVLATWEFDRDLFDRTTVQRMAAWYERLLAGAAAAPELRLSDLAIAGEAERHQILAEWSDTAAPFPAHACLHELVEGAAVRRPGAVAVVSAEEQITYWELDLRASRLARRLRDLGCGPDVPVGVLMERSVEMVVALLAVLKAGGAYLPLEPEHPPERLVWMMADAGAPILLTQTHLEGALPSGGPVSIALPPGWTGDGESASAGNGERPLPGHVAYVIYTSGSTGRPKGVMVPHRGIVNRLAWMQRAYGLSSEDRILQKTPFGFDVSVWEFFWTLSAGARLVVARPDGHRDSEYLTDLITREGVTVLHFVPSMLSAFLEEPDLSGCATLRLVVASGEALPPELARRCRERLPAALENLYGPTEASVDVTRWSCAAEGWNGTLPIGRPIDNVRTVLVDRWLAPAPVGVPGELCLGGVALARGYLGRPDLTAERFVPDAWSALAGERLYRTGDLARWLPDGTIEFLGRIDFQVKIRGFRIDLGEIEAVLASHPEVREVIVTASGPPASRRLAAYVVGGPEGAPASADLRRFLVERLPAYMVPAAIVPLAALPLSANGKVDRRALPVPAEPAAGRAVRAPANPVEAGLLEIAGEILETSPIHPDDNFFELGGDSIGALRLRTRIRRRFQVDPPLPRIFAHPTIAELATVILELQAEQAEPDDLEALLAELEGLTDGEARDLLAGEGVS